MPTLLSALARSRAQRTFGWIERHQKLLDRYLFNGTPARHVGIACHEA